MKNKGLFITFEGADGSGKSTQARFLYDALIGMGVSAYLCRDPGFTRISEKIRDILLDKENTEMAYMTESLLCAASRSQLTAEFIKPRLDLGHTVISDRFTDSSMAYQGVARDVGIQAIIDINNYATGGIAPDITFFIDIPPENAALRRQTPPDRFESEAAAFHRRVYEGYRIIANANPDRIMVVNGSNDPETIHKQILAILIKKFDLRGEITL